MKYQFIPILLLTLFAALLFANPKVAFAGAEVPWTPDIALFAKKHQPEPESDSSGGAGVESQPGVQADQASSEGEQQNQEALEQSEQPKEDIQQYAARVAEADANSETPDVPATPSNLNLHHKEILKDKETQEEEGAQREETKKKEGFDAV